MAKTIKVTNVDDTQNKIWVLFKDTTTGDELEIGMYPPDEFATETALEDWIIQHWPWDVFEKQKMKPQDRLKTAKTSMQKPAKSVTARVEALRPNHYKDLA